MDFKKLISLSKKGPWSPEPFWVHGYDSLFYFFKNSSYLEQRVDKYLTVFRSDSDDGLCGIQVEGFIELLRENNSLNELFKGPTKLGLILLAVRGLPTETFVDDSTRHCIYEKILNIVGTREIENPNAF